MATGAGSAPPGLRLVKDESERIVLAHEPPFRIGQALFRPATREVAFNGRTSIVEPRVMQFIVALHRADGAVVSKDDLARTCWDGRIVGEDAINRVVSRARSIAEKQAPGQFRIETITRVGYRLIEGNRAAESSVLPAEARPSPALDRRQLLVGGSAVAAAASLGGAGWFWAHRDPLPPDARVLVDDARNSLYQATFEQASDAVGKLRRATQIAPNSAEAWGLLALAYGGTSFGVPADQRSNILARKAEAARHAFAIEPDQPDALAAGLQGQVVFRNWYDRERSARSALSRHPDHPVLQVMLGHVLMQVGRVGEALALYTSALKETPICAPSLISRINILWDLGRFEEADQAVEHAFGLLPAQYGIWFTRLYYLMYNGRARDAAAMADDVATRPAGIPDWDFDLVSLAAHALASGDPAGIRNAVAAWSGAADKGSVFAENAAILAAYTGDVDEAFRMLDALYFDRGIRLADSYPGRDRHTYFLFHRTDAAMRRDPRFAVLTRQLGLDDYWRKTNSRSLVVA